MTNKIDGMENENEKGILIGRIVDDFENKKETFIPAEQSKQIADKKGCWWVKAYSEEDMKKCFQAGRGYQKAEQAEYFGGEENEAFDFPEYIKNISPKNEEADDKDEEINELLIRLADYFRNKADSEDTDTGIKPNREMSFLSEIEYLIK